jgi:hypothetical protein
VAAAASDSGATTASDGSQRYKVGPARDNSGGGGMGIAQDAAGEGGCSSRTVRRAATVASENFMVTA